jgi:pimeloyl-ACP methyl ester carboxylesterase
MGRLTALALAAGFAMASGSADAAATLQAKVSGQGTPVLMFPGLGCPASVWDGLAATLAKTHQVHQIEIPGFAGNAPLERDGALLPALEQAVGDYIEANGLDAPVLIGHSFGGFFSTYLATRSPQRYGAVVALDGVPFYSALFDPDATVDSAKPFAEQMRAGMLAQDEAAFAAQQAFTLTTMMKDSAKALELAKLTSRSDRSTVADAMTALITTDLRADLARLDDPLLLIGATGAIPDATMRAQAEQTYRAQLASGPKARLAVATQARHFVQYDDPAWLERTVLEFLDAKDEAR